MENSDLATKCIGCKFYRKRYIIMGNRLIEVYGMCTQKGGSFRKLHDPFAFQKKCMDWQKAEEIQTEQIKHSVKEAIRQINDRLAVLLLIMSVVDSDCQ